VGDLMRTLFRNVRLFDPGAGVDGPGRHVLVLDDRIASLDAPPDAAAERVVEGAGALLCPGLVDLRCHLCEPGRTDRETVATGVASAARGGFTTVVAMPTTDPTIDRVEVVETIKTRAAEAGATRVLPAGAMSEGRQGERLAEMAKLRDAGCVLFTDADLPVPDSQLLRYALETAGDLNVPVATHAEDVALSQGGVMHEGQCSIRLGLDGIPGAAEEVGVARDLAVAELTGARLHIAHVSTAGAVELIRQAKRRGARVTAEVSPLHLCLTEAAVLGYDPAAKLFPPLRTRRDVNAVVDGLADGTLDAVASDHTPRTALEKNREFDRAEPGAVSLETTLGVVLTLVARRELTLERAVHVLTRAPAKVLGRNDIGRLTEGGHADLVLIDPEAEWTVQPQAFGSRSTNTPLAGAEMRGRARLTMARGRVTHEMNHDGS
jgi:dihydroorotase